MDLVLPLFPAGSLDSSVVTTVWVGVFVVCLFNLRFGWVLSGLVVPGYLVPMLLARPWSAVAIVVEAIATYQIVRFCSDHLLHWLGASSIFGRDRFFALVLVSVIVRLFADGWAWPLLGQALEAAGYTEIDLQGNMHSVGLVIIALTANLFWKTGVLRGLIPFLTTIAVTYLIVRYGLMEWTNFSISSLSYMYEDVATSVLASPKAYIILLTTAYIASRMNLVYGWDFNGILLPSLIALQWYQPGKILATFVEATIILLVASALLRTRWFAGTTVEGARKLLLFFNVGFAWKVLLGFLIPFLLPDAKVSDYFAFGYVLSTLLAIKIHDKGIFARLTRATVQTSIVAVSLASLVGFALSQMPRLPYSFPERDHAVADAMIDLPIDPSERIRQDRLQFYEARGLQAATPTATELDEFAESLTLLADPRALTNADLQRLAVQRLARIGFDLQLLQGRFFYLRERAPARGKGIYVLAPTSTSELLIECPTAGYERGMAEAGAVLFREFDARGLALSGSRPMRGVEGGLRDVGHEHFQVFHRVLARRNVLQIRGDDQHSGQIAPTPAEGRNELGNRLWVKHSLPPGLDLARLKSMLSQLEVEFATPAFPNPQRTATISGFAELFLDRAALRKLLARSNTNAPSLRAEVAHRQIIGYLNEWLFTRKDAIAPRGSEAYLAPTLADLLFFDEEILSPLAHLVVEEYRDGRWTETGSEELREIGRQLHRYGYELVLYRDLGSDSDYVILRESPEGQRRYWGTYLLRPGPAQRYLIEVPRPGFEAGSLEYGAALFERLHARALLIAGAHPRANRDGSADVLLPSNRMTLFNLANQVLLREGGQEEQLVVQARAFGQRPDVGFPNADALITIDDAEPIGSVPFPPLVLELLDRLKRDGLRYEFTASLPQTAGYDLGFNPQARYRQANSSARFASIRLAPRARLAFREQSQNRAQIAQFEALGIPTEAIDLRAMLLAIGNANSRGSLPLALRQAVQLYQLRPDVLTLRRIQKTWPQFRLRRLLDRDSLAAFLAVYGAHDVLLGIFNLEPRQPIVTARLIKEHDAAEVIDAFLGGSYGALLIGDEP